MHCSLLDLARYTTYRGRPYADSALDPLETRVYRWAPEALVLSNTHVGGSTGNLKLSLEM